MYPDIDVFDSHGIQVAAYGAEDRIASLYAREAGNYTVRVRSEGVGSLYYSYNWVGNYLLKVSERVLFATTVAIPIRGSVEINIPFPGDRVIGTFALPSASDTGSAVDVIVTTPSNNNLRPRVGVFVNSSTPNTDTLACRCHLPSALPLGTAGAECGFHASYESWYPWCFVSSECEWASAFSSSHVYVSLFASSKG